MSIGKSILEEIIDVRFEKLLDLLEKRHVALGTLAGQTGFTSENQLQRQFKARFEMTLSDYRKRNSPKALSSANGYLGLPFQ